MIHCFQLSEGHLKSPSALPQNIQLLQSMSNSVAAQRNLSEHDITWKPAVSARCLSGAHGNSSTLDPYFKIMTKNVTIHLIWSAKIIFPHVIANELLVRSATKGSLFLKTTMCSSGTLSELRKTLYQFSCFGPLCHKVVTERVHDVSS